MSKTLRRVAKYLGLGFAALLVLLVAAGLWLTLLFDPNDYKPMVTELVQQRTGRSFSIDDDLRLSFYPWLAVETGGITIGNAEGFAAGPFATIERVSARVALWPLLRRRIEIGLVSLDGLQLNLSRDDGGRGNWQDLLPGTGAGAATGEPAGEPRATSLDIAGIRIRDGRLHWRENGNEMRYIVSDINLGTGPISPGSPIDLALAFKLLDVGSQLSVELDSHATAAWLPAGGFQANDVELEYRLLDGRSKERAGGRFELVNLSAATGAPVEFGQARLSAVLIEPPVGAEQIDIALAWPSASLNLDDESFVIDTLTASADAVQTQWRLEGNGILGAARLTGSVELISATAKDAAELLAVALPEDLDAETIAALEFGADFTATLEPLRVELTAAHAGALGIQATGRASLDGRERLAGHVDIAPFTPPPGLRAWARQRLPAGVDVDAFDRLAVAADIDADLATGAWSVQALQAELLGASLNGRLARSSRDAGGIVSGALRAAPFAADRFGTAFKAWLPSGVDAHALGRLAFDAEFSHDAEIDTAVFETLAVEAFGLRTSGQLTASQLSVGPRLQGRVQIAAFQPRELLRRIGRAAPPTTDDTVLSRASLNTRFDVNAEYGRFDDIDLRLDDSRIGGELTLVDFAQPRFRFALSVDALDIDRYLPPPRGNAEGGGPSETGEPLAGDIELAAVALDGLDVSGRARIDSLKLAGLSLRAVEADVGISDGRLDLKSARAELYGGQFDGSLRVDTRPPTGMALSGRAQTVQLEPLITALTGDSRLSGTGSLTLDLSGTGATVVDNVANASGRFSFVFHDGAIEGFNLGHTLCKLFNASQGFPPPSSADPVTEYELLQGSATVSDGVAVSEDLLARTAYINSPGRGRMSLVEQRLDYAFDAELTGSIDIRGCQTMDRLIGGSVPWTITGTLDAPNIEPDFEAYLRQRAREELEERLRERLQDKIRDLF